MPLPPNAVEPEERALIRAVLAQSLDDSFDVLAAEEPADRSWERLHQPAKTSGETSWLMTQPALQRVLTEASSHIAALAGRPTDQRPDARPRVVLTFDLLREKYSSVLSRERQHTTTKGVIDESASKSSVVEIERPGIFERLLKDGPAVSDHGQRVPSIHHSYPPSITTRQGGRRKGIWIGSARDATSIQTPSGLSWRDAPDQQVEVLLLSASKAPKLYRLHQADIGPALALAAEVADTPRGESVRVVDISPYDERQDWTVNLHPTVVGHDIAAFLVRIDLAIARALIGGFPMETEGGYRHLASIAHLNYRLGSGAALGAFSSSNDLYEFVVNELWGQSAYRSVAARAILDRLSNPKGQDLSGLDRCLDLHKLSSFEKCLAAYDGPARKRISFKLNAGLAYSHTPATDATCGTSSALKKVSVDIHLEAQEDGRPRVAELTDSRSIEIPELERAAKETRARICRRLRGDANTRSDVERVDSFASLSRDLGVAVLHNPDIAVRAVALLANAPPFKADGLVPAAAREADYIVHRPATFSHELLRNVKAMSAHIRPLLSGQADPATRVAATRVSQTLHKCTRYLQERIPKGLDLTPSALEASPCLTPDRVFRNRDVKELASNDEVAADIARIARLGITIDRREAIRREVRPVSALIGNR